MNFSFLSSEHGLCLAKLWATGRYGFSLPKKVDITVPGGDVFAYLYYNKKAGLKSELTNRVIVRIAIAHFLSGRGSPQQAIVIDEATAPYEGNLKQIPSSAARPPALLRVRPGKCHARIYVSDETAGPALPAPAEESTSK